MMHPHTELRFINHQIGFGVFATQFIPKGTITWVLDDLDQRLDESYVFSTPPVLRERLLKYSYRDEQGKYILCWDIAKFVNHSFNSSNIGTAYSLELAARDIYPGEELTDDYGYFNLDKPFDCFPESGCDRTRVLPDDILRYYPEWDRKAAAAFTRFNQVDQPLKVLIDEIAWEKLVWVASGQTPMESILNCYYDRTRPLKAVS
ncbi:SET domain-containing protein-lysine N-methyltransferase [Leptolyngbya sp. 'hensonii']|uniref:SET domain-containing protein n=1 Tax=Leptolyngbya sp. 'hensonii' TaxID=1922337 RepID=UPI00094FFABE|nr:SET domain-containing protein [Leptolyngbya sp. 'hensonii']OLP17538.1 SET domain-containing protein-lysine N-methyltransferase [Leptolyngbya sp. 'hensonii']